jgi:hypothetical protein
MMAILHAIQRGFFTSGKLGGQRQTSTAMPNGQNKINFLLYSVQS